MIYAQLGMQNSDPYLLLVTVQSGHDIWRAPYKGNPDWHWRETTCKKMDDIYIKARVSVGIFTADAPVYHGGGIINTFKMCREVND